MDRVETEEVIHRVKEDGADIHTVKKRKAHWICHILRGNFLQRLINRERWKKCRSDRKTREKTKAVT
jgi:hypothetical protein